MKLLASRRGRRCTLAFLLALHACGGRTTLLSGSSDPVEARQDAATSRPPEVRDAGAEAAVSSDATALLDAGDLDPCPSLLLPGAPRAMLASCSTRDGRARVVGPTAPHTIWSRSVMEASGESSFIALGADASESVYLVVGDDDGNFGSLVRLDAATGEIDWAASYIPPTSSYGAPLLLASGTVEIVAGGSPGAGSGLERFDVGTGAETWGTFGPGQFVPSGDPAVSDPPVGADGSLYVAYPFGNTGDEVISRIGPSGTTVWRSADVHTLLPSRYASEFYSVDAAILALGQADLVLVPLVVTAPDNPQVTFVVALDPSSGARQWAEEVEGPLLGGPAVASDGSIAVLVGPGVVSSSGPLLPTTLVVFESSGGRRFAAQIGNPETATLFALSGEGTAFIGIGSELGEAFDTLLAVDASGSTRWSVPTPGLETLTLDGHGTLLVATSSALEGVSSANGHTLYSLPPPRAGAAFVDATFTSSGGIVAVLSDGSTVGARD